MPRLELIPFSYPLSIPPFERKGYYIRTWCGGIGELAPFPTTHRESLEEALEALKRGDCSYPSVAFALDMAYMHVPKEKVSSYRLITDGDPLPQVPMSVKLKIGKNMESDLKRIRTLLYRGCSVRLDANRAFDVTTGIQFARRCKGLRIEYIEEPLRQPRALPYFYKETGMPIALDETLYQYRDWDLIPGIKALVIKPAAIGSIEKVCKMAAYGKERGFRVIISSCFQTPIGIDFLARLAAQISPNELAGLDTLRYFKGIDEEADALASI